MFCSFNLGGGGRAGNRKGSAKIINTDVPSVAKIGTNIINTNANTNKNTGAKVTINSRAPEAPSDGSGDGTSDGYGRWGYKPYYHRSGGAPKAPKGQGEVRQGKRTGGKGKDLILVN